MTMLLDVSDRAVRAGAPIGAVRSAAAAAEVTDGQSRRPAARDFSAPRWGRSASGPSRGPVWCPQSAPARRYRMGRWERLSMTIIVVVAMAVAAFTVLGGSTPPAHDVVVQPGDSMLSIALREFPGMDPARAAELIAAENGPVDLTPGATLLIPAVR